MGSESPLAKALKEVQAELKPIPRTRRGQAGGRKTKYADLAAVEDAVFPLLARAGLAWLTKPIIRSDGRFVLYYALIHVATSEREDGEYPLHESSAQQNGGEVTYARRCTLQAVTGAVAEGDDDDGAAASEAQVNRQQRPPRPPSRPTATPVHAATTGPGHERLRHGTVEATPEDRAAERTRGPLPDDANPWQDLPPEEQPGSADPKDVKGIQIAYGKLKFDTRTDRAQLLGISGQIVRRPLTSHNDLTFGEAQKLRHTLEGFQGDRGALMERLSGITQAVAAVGAQDAAEDTQEAGTDA